MAGRFQWRPSPVLIVAVLLIGVLAALACLGSDLPVAPAWCLAIVALVYALRVARREWRRPGFELVVTVPGGPRIDGCRVEGFALAWRGPLGVMTWQAADGRVRRRLWLPDTLPALARRELRLALMRGRSMRGPQSMAR